MATIDAGFSSEEITEVVGHYNIGEILQTQPLIGGSRHAPKVVIISENGKFLIKRRQKIKGNFDRVRFSHAVQNHLAIKGFPTTKLQGINGGDETMLLLNNYIYELFEFVSGKRYDTSPETTAEVGRQLAMFHSDLVDFTGFSDPERVTFHDSPNVRKYLKTIEADRRNSHNIELLEIVDSLMSLYNGCSTNVNSLGYDKWERQVIHGDWHPGNMLFEKNKLTAVLDFDSVKIAPAVIDLANGMLQFSIVGNRPNPADWPDYLNQEKLIQFLNGYRQIIDLEINKVKSLLDLMIETMIAETVLPVATTGSFGNLGGEEFLKMIFRKAKWIADNKKTLIDAMTQ